MPQDLQTFLTLPQAIDAVAVDFMQYGPQTDLFRKIGPLILGNDFKTGIFNGFERVWIRRNNGHPFEPVDDTTFGFYLIHVLETSEKDVAEMAHICALVFQTPTSPGVVNGESGVWVKNHMDDFVCKRCGNCCSQLGNTCVQEDRQLWENSGRGDILSWVKEEQLDGGEIQYRIWIDPKTGKPAESCPFLASQPGKTTFWCTIQKVKPLVCREFPLTKKHALYTGCLGFE